jgi:hypothetical protein
MHTDHFAAHDAKALILVHGPMKVLECQKTRRLIKTILAIPSFSEAGLI